jgi:beta-N-acetylhexosaminidase
VIAAGVVGGGYALLAGGDDEGPKPHALKRLAGQTIVAKLGKGGPDGALLRRVRQGRLGGLILTQPREPALAAQLSRLQHAAEAGDNPPLLVMVDQEGGEVKRLPGPPDASPPELGEAGDAEAARAEGEATGAYLRELGVNVDLAPVLDVAHEQTAETIASRTFGDDPALVAELGSAFIEGLQSTGVAATAKHFPGLGLATVNTDFGPVTVAGAPAELSADLEPFRAAIEAGTRLVMISTAAYPALGAREPATFTAGMIDGRLRDELGFGGVVVTDDLEASAATTAAGSPQRAAVRALAAGADLALFPRTEGAAAGALEAVVQAAKSGRLERSLLETAHERILALKESLAG